MSQFKCTFGCFLLLIIIKETICDLEAYTGPEPIESTSPLFSIKLTQNNTSIYPHVYYSKVNVTYYNDECTNGHVNGSRTNDIKNNNYGNAPTSNCNRTISWIEFGQKLNDNTLIQISSLENEAFFNNTIFPINIYPLSYNIKPIKIYNNYTSISFNITNNFKSISIEFGNFTNINCNKYSNYINSLLIFVGDITEYINTSLPNVLTFKSGAHNITNNNSSINVLNISSNIDTIYFERGAYVYGKINDTAAYNTKSILSIIGYGILSGEYFDYCNRKSSPLLHSSMIETKRSTKIHGLTIINPSYFMLPNELAINSVINNFKGIGWYVNQDCIGVSNNGLIINSFCRSADDLFKLETGNNITLLNNVAWALYNGNIHEMGWFGKGCTNCYISDTDIIHAEWSYNNETKIVISLQGTGEWNSNSSIYNNIIFNNIRIDSSVGRIFGVIFSNISKGIVHTLNNITISNLHSRQPLKWWRMNNSVKIYPIQQFIDIQQCQGDCQINGVYFKNITIGNNKIMNNNDKMWNLDIESNDIYNVTYS